MHDIYSLSNQNTAYIQTCYGECCNCIDSTRLQDFENHLAEKGELTVAVFTGFAFNNALDGKMHYSGRDQHDLVLSNILKAGAYLNAYEQFADAAQREFHFSKFKNERTVFDGTFTEGQKFKYLNFNNGQLGIPAFGDFTLAFPLAHFQADKLVFVKYNSLIRKATGSTQCLYFTENNESVLLETLEKDLSTLAQCRNLIVLKRKEDLENGTDIDHNLLVLKPFANASKHRDYVEAIAWQPINIKNGVRLRSEKERFQALIDAITNPRVKLGAEIKNITELQTLINRYENDELLATELI